MLGNAGLLARGQKKSDFSDIKDSNTALPVLVPSMFISGFSILWTIEDDHFLMSF